MAKTTLWPNKQSLPSVSTGRSFLRGFSLSLRSSNAKRRSAVELLAESKSHYVKSEAVLDAKQEFKYSEHLHVSSSANRLSFTSLVKSQRPPPSSLPINNSSGNKSEKLTSLPARTRPKTPSFNERDAQSRPRPKTPSECYTPQINRKTKNKDIEMQLRKLLGADSRDNLAVSDSPSGDQSIHKSMPDLLSNTDDGGSLAIRTSKSVESRSRATSDYVSRTPSARLDSISNHVSDISLSEEEEEEEVKPVPPHRRPILRSKSDISYRFFRSTAPVESPKRRESCAECSKNPETCKINGKADIFFESMGLDSATLQSVKQPISNHSSPIFFELDSSLDSLSSSGPRRRASTDSNKSGQNGGNLTDEHLKIHAPTDTSIVERNARVIKWLLHCRRLHKEQC